MDKKDEIYPPEPRTTAALVDADTLRMLETWHVREEYLQAGQVLLGVTADDLPSKPRQLADKVKDLLTPLDTSIPKKAARVDRLRQFYITAYSDIDLVLLCIATHSSRMASLRGGETLDAARRILAEENEDIFVPLCDFLGLWSLRCRLGDISLGFLRPTERVLILDTQKAWSFAQDVLFQQLQRTIQEALEVEAPHFRVSIRRHKSHTFNIYQKMALRSETLSELSDTVGRLKMDVVVEQQRDCFEVRSLIQRIMSHSAQGFSEGKGFSRERIDKPKFNGHRVLITTCVRASDQYRHEDQPSRVAIGKIHISEVEFHILTEAMFKVNIDGVVAARSAEPDVRDNISAWWTDTARRQTFLQKMRGEDGDDMVFSPVGELYDLKTGATPIDFAYRVHSGMGSHCKRIWVNGRPARHDQVLKTGDLVEVEADPAYVGPLEKWVGAVKTSTAKREIRRVLLKPRLSAGEKVFQGALGKELERRGMWGLPDREVRRRLEEKAVQYGFVDVSAMYVDLGTGEVWPKWRKALLNDIITSLVDTALAEHIIPTDPAAASFPAEHYQLVRCSHENESCRVIVGKAIAGRRVGTAAGQRLLVYPADCPDTPQGTDRIALEWKFQSQPIAMTVTAPARPMLAQQISAEVHKLADRGLSMLDLHSEAHGQRESTVGLILKASTPLPLQELVTALAHMKAAGAIESFHLGEYDDPRLSLPQPYSPADGMNDLRLFMGRKKEVEKIEEAANQPKLSQRLFQIVGNNRIGKSSLLQFLSEYFSSKKSAQVIPVSINLQEPNDESEHWLWRELVEKTSRALSEFAKHADVAFFTLPSLPPSGPMDYRAAKTWLKHAQAGIGMHRLLIMIDELHLIDRDWGPGEAKATFKNLRDLVRSQRDDQSRREAMFVVSVLDAYYSQQDSFWKNEKFGFNLLCDSVSIPLRHLEDPDARKLIEEPMRGMLDFDPQVKSCIIRDTSGHPYYLQHMLHRIVDRASRGSHLVMMEDYKVVREKLCVEEQHLFMHFLRDVGSTGRDLLAAAAQAREDQWVTPSGIRRNWRPRHAVPTLAEIQEQLPLLIRRGVLKDSPMRPGKYSFEIPLFAEWLRHNPAQLAPRETKTEG